MSNSGQSCDAPTRMLVEKSIYKRAIEEAADEANKIKVDLLLKKEIISVQLFLNHNMIKLLI